MKFIAVFAFFIVMINDDDLPHWPALMRPLTEASAALGGLAHALENGPLHQAWLWRETARTAAKIAQFQGYRVKAPDLMRYLAGLPLPHAPDDDGLAAARRVFLATTPLLRPSYEAKSNCVGSDGFPPLWAGEPDFSTEGPDERAGEAAKLQVLVTKLVAFAGDGNRPKLIDLLLEIRRLAGSSGISTRLLRLSLPLAIHRAGLLPKAAPWLLGGQLTLGTTRSAEARLPVTLWLTQSLKALAKEADESRRRLDDLTGQFYAWYQALLAARLRRQAKLPRILDLLAVTPVVSASLVARHLDCTPQGAGQMLRQLQGLGIVAEATSRARWKIFLAVDLTSDVDEEDPADRPLLPSQPLPELDRDALEDTMHDLLQDLERLNDRAQERVKTGA